MSVPNVWLYCVGCGKTWTEPGCECVCREDDLHYEEWVTVNEFGTPVSVHTCDACGELFTVCPPVDIGKWGTGCLAEGCPSYDISRDIDLFWNDPTIRIERIPR